jgi:hypothetical protein
MELRQMGGLETYIQDFDILWNWAEISEKQALVFFIGGLKIEIKNPSPLSRPATFLDYKKTLFHIVTSFDTRAMPWVIFLYKKY